MTTWRDDTEREIASGCAAFEAALPDYLDGALGSEAADAAAAHLAACRACQSLVLDLRGMQTQAAALPVLRPSRDLWGGVEARIRQTAGAQISTGRAGSARGVALRRWFGPQYAGRVAALAASLVIATAAVTYTATRWLGGGSAIATQPIPRQTAAIQSPTAPAPSVTRAAAPTAVTPPGAGPGRVTEVSGRAVTPEYLYDAQIASLHKILDQRRSQLSPKTVAVIERSLSVIDTAIAQSKAALANDPGNGFLADQLGRDLDTKLELLRTVALLPSHT
jgi:hypothetical protein